MQKGVNHSFIKFSLAGIFLLFCVGFTIQLGGIEQLLANLLKRTESYPQEKVHLQTDKPYYAIGEDIFFKAYLVTAETNRPSYLSTVLYVDLIDEKNEVRKHILVPISKGMGAGSISLINLENSGTYRLRAYTNYMRNYDDDFFFEKFVSIGNVLDKATAEATNKKELDLSLQFFPEGGNLIAGLRNKVGVKAVTPDGLGANLSGYIINSKKEKVAVFTTEHAGMGAFAYNPEVGEKYMAVVTSAGGKDQAFKLPEAAASGYMLSVNQIGENIKVGIGLSKDLVGAGNLNVIAQANGKVYASFTANSNKQTMAALLPKKDFPTGIIQVTLFSADNRPLAERMIFVNRENTLNIVVQNSSPDAGIKQKSKLAFFVTDKEGSPIDGNFSVSVTDAGKVPINEDDETTILSNLLLTSDLKGFIEQPNYYFNHPTEDKARQLDNLLLTQGWRRFTWQDIAAGKEPDITFRPEQSLEISGKITNLYGKPLANAKVVLLSKSTGIPLILDTVSDAKGNFVFDRLDISDSTTFTVQAKGLKDGKDVKIIMNESAGVSIKKFRGNSIDLLPYLETTKQQFKVLDKQHMLHTGILIKEVEISAEKAFTSESVLRVKGSTNASGSANHVIPREQMEKELTVAGALNKVLGVKMVGNLPVTTRAPKAFSNGNKSTMGMLVIVDGTVIPIDMTAEVIRDTNPKDIEGIEVLTSSYYTAIYGAEGSNGVIHITTKKGNSNPVKSMPYALLKNRGYTAVKEFYMPDYSDPKIDKNALDLRSTIFWQPMLITDKKGEATLSYFNAGTQGTYRVTIEGMDAYGAMGRKVFTYEVKEKETGR